MNGPSETDEVLFGALGEAVAKFWSNLPHAVQQDLFEEAVTSHGETVDQCASALEGSVVSIGNYLRKQRWEGN